MSPKRSAFVYFLSLSAAALTIGCAQLSPEMQQLSSQVLGSAGIPGVNSTQINTAFAVQRNLSGALSGLTEEEEYYLGRGVSAMVFSKYQPLRNNAINNYLNKVGRVVAGVSERPETFSGYRFAALDSNEVNAFAAPGGFIFVTRGLLKAVPDEDALAAVLAHEVAHVVQAHGVKAIAQANLTEAFVLIGKQAASTYSPADLQLLTDAFGDSISDVFETMLSDGYSRSQEYDSDAYAVKLATMAGYNPNGLANTLKRLEAMQGDGGWFSTHPDPDDRLEEIEDVSKPDSTQSKEQSLRAQRFNQAMKSLS